MVFGEKLRDAFSGLSWDRNPLHLDGDYARKTPFGKPVLFGMAAVLFGLGEWAKGRRFMLKSITGGFPRPVYLGEEFNIKFNEGPDGHVSIGYFQGDTAHCEFSFRWGPPAQAGFSRAPGGKAFEPRLNAAVDVSFSDGPVGDGNFAYSPNWEDEAGIKENFHLSFGQFPCAQLSALLWASYFVGMEVPGRQGLFAGFEFSFDPHTVDGKEFLVSDLKLATRPVFDQLVIAGSGTGLRAFSLSAFRRPLPVKYPLDVIRSALGWSREWAGKVVMISGAGRGFGAVLAKAFALRGARLVLNHRKPSVDILEVESELRSIGTDVLLAEGDVGEESGCRRVLEAVKVKHANVDILINNAFPHIVTKAFSDQSEVEFIDFVARSVKLSSRLSRCIIPLIPPGGFVVNISSIYTQSPKARLSHYVAAKSAVEGLARVLALEFPKVNFAIARPGKMLTDQTNVVFDMEPAPSPISIAGTLLDQLRAGPWNGNLLEMNLLKTD